MIFFQSDVPILRCDQTDNYTTFHIKKGTLDSLHTSYSIVLFKEQTIVDQITAILFTRDLQSTTIFFELLTDMKMKNPLVRVLNAPEIPSSQWIYWLPSVLKISHQFQAERNKCKSLKSPLRSVILSADVRNSSLLSMTIPIIILESKKNGEKGLPLALLVALGIQRPMPPCALYMDSGRCYIVYTTEMNPCCLFNYMFYLIVMVKAAKDRETYSE